MRWTSLCELNELEQDKGKYVQIDGFELAVFLHQGGVYVLDNNCPHAGGNLGSGYVLEGCAVCPWHHWAFRLDNGALRDSPGVMVKTYATRIHTHNQVQLVQVMLPIY